MKRNILLLFTKFLYALFIICTITMLFIVYTNTDNDIVPKFEMCYFYLTIFTLIYMLLTTILNLIKLERVELRKRLLRFICILALIFSIKCGFDYIFTHSKIDLLNVLQLALGIAFGDSFIDIMFFVKEKNLTAKAEELVDEEEYLA